MPRYTLVQYLDELLILSFQVYAQKETCSEELLVEKLVLKGLQQVVLPQGGTSNQKSVSPKLVLVWGSTMYHIDDIPFSTKNLPDVYTQFRKVSSSLISKIVTYKGF